MVALPSSYLDLVWTLFFGESVENRLDASKFSFIIQSCLNVEEIIGYHGLRVAKTRNKDVHFPLKIG